MRHTSLNMVYELAKEDSRVVFIGSDLGPGVLNDFKENIPERFMMEESGTIHYGILSWASKRRFHTLCKYNCYFHN